MKRPTFIELSVGLIVTTGLFLMLVGCVSKGRVTEYEVTKSGKNWVQTESVHKHRENGKVMVDKQFVYEKMKCVNKKGKKIEASTPEECIKLGGTVVVETMVDEQILEKQ